MKDGVVPYAASPADANAGMDEAICAECGTGCERRLRQDYRARADGSVRANHYQRPDRRAFSNYRIR